jgi:hypothetical protein
LGATRDWVVHRIQNGTIDVHYVSHHPLTNIVLIQNDPALVRRLRKLLPKNRSV